MTPGRLLAGSMVVVVVVVGLAAVVANRSGSGGSATSERTYRDLCSSLGAAEAGDVNDASKLFTDRVHGPLHALAAETAETDRAAAARPLESKNAVEAKLNSGSHGLPPS